MKSVVRGSCKCRKLIFTSFPEDEDSYVTTLLRAVLYMIFFPLRTRRANKQFLASFKGPGISALISYRTVCLTFLEWDGVVGVYCQWNPSALTWACSTTCPAGLVSTLLASDVHQEDWELQKTKTGPTWKNLFIYLQEEGDSLKPTSFLGTYLYLTISIYGYL